MRPFDYESTALPTELIQHAKENVLAHFRAAVPKALRLVVRTGAILAKAVIWVKDFLQNPEFVSRS